jgi:hypothetical protein
MNAPTNTSAMLSANAFASPSTAVTILGAGTQGRRLAFMVGLT